MWKEKLQEVVNYIVKHSKIVFPVIVIAAVAVTVAVALSAGNKDKLEEGADQTTDSTDATDSELPSGDEDIPMVANEDSAISELIYKFYNAMGTGEVEDLESSCDEIATQDLLKYQERAKYIDHYSTIEIYTKPGPETGSTIVFVYYKVVFVDHPEELPGYTAYYVCTDDQGNLYIKRGEVDDSVNEYIGKVMSQDDVVELNNKVALEYSDLMSEHPELLEYLSELDTQVNTAVGVELADQNSDDSADGTTQTEAGAEGADQAETGADTAAQGGDTGSTDTGAGEETPAENTVQYATATTTVNVRSSDSENADKMGKVPGGTQVQVLEQKVNGWTKISFEGKEGYVKSEFLQASSTESAEGMTSIGTVTATTNINIRSSASESADKIGVLAGGDSAELLSKDNGWCQIKYNGKVGYVKSDYVQ